VTAWPTATAPVLAGIDVGGTKIGCSIGTMDAQVLAADRFSNDPTSEPAAVLGRALQCVRRLAADLRQPVAALGLSVPGPLSYVEGRLLAVPNMPRWHGFPLRAWLADSVDVPAEFMNDANASMLAEARFGAARGATSAIFLTMSTGMGAGLWLDGRVYEGPRALAGEIGHVRLCEDGPVGFGVAGSVEGFLSGPGIVQLAQAERLRAQQRGEATALSEYATFDAEVVCELARSGDLAASRTISRVGRELGRLCALLTDILDPEVIVFGTIGTAHFDLFEPLVRAGLEEHAIAGANERVRLRRSGLSDRGNQTALAVAARLLDGDDG
jgi:glucokinase